MKAYLLFAALILALNSYGQVTETVNFDNYTSSSNNDFTNKFTVTGAIPSVMSQINDSGISGGCLRTPHSGYFSWYNVYCSKYKNSVGAVFNTSICFKVDTSTFSTSTNYSCAIALLPNGSTNAYVWAEYSYWTGQMTIWVRPSTGTINYSWPATVLNGHWYKLHLMTKTVSASSIYAKSFLYDLGTSGSSSSLIDTVSLTCIDYIFAPDTAINVAIFGGLSSAVRYLDSFSFSGYKNSDTCIHGTVSDESLSTNKPFDVSEPIPNPNNGSFSIECFLPEGIQTGQLILYNPLGQISKRYDVRAKQRFLTIENSTLPAGLYYYYLVSDGQFSGIKKMIIIN